MLDRETLDLLARCLEYPASDTPALARCAAERAASDHIALARALWDLAVWLETTPAGEAEERYTALFDLTPVCSLHVGYQVFGDTYPRGAFIAGLSGELRRSGLTASGLPDELPTVLRLLGRLPDPEDAATLLQLAVLPALKKMSEALAESSNPWGGVISALPELLSEAGPLPELAASSSETAHA
jgi:nitrate reductase delta subunit